MHKRMNQIISEFLSEIIKARKHWNDIVKSCKIKSVNQKSLSSVFFQNEGEVSTFIDKPSVRKDFLADLHTRN